MYFLTWSDGPYLESTYEETFETEGEMLQYVNQPKFLNTMSGCKVDRIIKGEIVELEPYAVATYYKVKSTEGKLK